MRINRKRKGSLLGILVVFVAVLVLYLVGNKMEDIPDTNGSDPSLTTITSFDIISEGMGNTGYSSGGDFPTGKRYQASEFSGLLDLYRNNFLGDSTVTLTVDSKVTAGNCRIVLVYEEAIYHEFELNGTAQSYTLENVSGLVRLVLAGESAEFEVEIWD